MKLLALLFALLATPAMADPVSDSVATDLGRLIIQTKQCQLQVQQCQAELDKLKPKPSDPTKPAEVKPVSPSPSSAPAPTKP